MKAVLKYNEWMAIEDIELLKKVYRYLYEIPKPKIYTKSETQSLKVEAEAVEEPSESELR